jgi:hypothetical protein
LKVRADVTGDGVVDIVGVAAAADVAGVVDAGAVYLWTGGPSLAGAAGPTATWTIPNGFAGDLLGRAGY